MKYFIFQRINDYYLNIQFDFFENNFKMSQQDSVQSIPNQSNLLLSTIDVNKQSSGTNSKSHDQTPIGGKKFQFSQFPQDGEQIKKPLKKPPARFRKKAEQNQAPKNQQTQTPKPNEALNTQIKIQGKNPDDIPIGGKKFQFSQFPEQGQQPKKVVKKPPAKFLQRMKKQQNKQQQSANGGEASEVKNADNIQIGGSKKNNFDDQPIGGNKGNPDDRPIGAGNKNNFDDQPIGGGNKNNFDDQPIGGGKKVQMSEYPQQGAPKPAPKKATKKATKAPVKTEVPIDDKPITPQVAIDDLPVGGGMKRQGFDEQPIGKNNNFMMSQFPEGNQQPVVETNYTMGQKLKSKAVQMKLSGMTDLLKLLQTNPNSDQLAQIQIGKLLKQTNPACLEKILQCFKIWVNNGKKWGDDQVKSVIENGYINGKANTIKLAIEIVDQMYQKSPDVVQMAILVGLKGKVPKTLAGYIGFLNQLLKIYGMKRMKFFKPYFSDIITILNREKLVAVKTQGINLLKQCYKWLSKEIVEPMTKDLKQNLKKQLESFWQSYDKATVMTAPKDIPDANDGKGKKKVDAYQLSQAVDIFKKYNEKWSQTVISEQKWNQKVKMMQQFISAATVPKLAHTQFRHITQMVRRLINHSNFNVVLNTLKVLAVLSKGLRRPFAPTVKSQFSNVISKFRDKKTQMIDQTFSALNQFNYCISIEDVIDDVKQGLADKTPNMKINLLNWIGKFVEKKVQEKDEVPQKAKQAIRSLFPIFEKLLADGVAQVRDTMVKNIGKMKILMGDQFFAAMDKKMSKGQTGKLEQVTKQLPVKKVSKQKDPKSGQQPPSKPPKDSGIKSIQNNSKISNQGSKDISEQLLQYMAKMNHSDWQKRKQSAEAIINLISNNMQAKINSTVLFDFLNTLKARIADPNKNIVKYFVQLTGLIFQTMSDRQIKNNARNFICALADGLSDKVEANRKEIAATINKLGGIYGRQQLLTILGSYLDSDKQSRIQILNIILQNAEFLEKADTKQYPKGIIKGLTDKNKEIRNLAEKLLQRIHQKVGLDTFKNLAKNQRPAIAKDLNTLLSKYQGAKVSTSTLSKGVSPPKNNSNQNNSKLVPPQPPSGKKTMQRSQSKGSKAYQQSFEKQQTEELTIKNSSSHQFYSTIQPGSGVFLKQNKSMVEGNQDFAPLKLLSTQRVHRQQKDERYPWACDNLSQNQEQQLCESLDCLFKAEQAKKMMSIDYRKVTEAALQIIKLSKDIAHHNQIREVYDLIFKWVFIRLWGGNPPINTILQVLPHVMSILQKKKLAINDGEVDIIVAILRESFITGYMNDYKVSESLYLITKLLKVLSSGDRLLKKLLRQFSVQLTSIHRHVRKQATEFYRVGLGKLIKNQLMDYVGNGSSLEEASRIKQLKSDPEFVDLLYKRFHQNVLDSFGFRNNINSSVQQQATIRQQQPQKKTEQPYQSTQIQSKSQIQVQGKRTPTQSTEGRQTITSRPEQNSRQSYRNQEIIQPHPINVMKQPQIKQQFDDELDLRLYAMPPPGNPLGRHLAKLMTPNDLADTTVAFFTNFFADGGEKISAELVTYANIIFGAILKSVKFVIDHRNDHIPQKIVNQINLLQQAIRCKFIINHIDQQLLYHGTRFALYQLVYEDEHKNMIAQDLISKGIDFKPDQFVKVINGIMLRILENACPQQIVNILLNLLNKQLQLPQVSQKTISLIIKCLSRVASNYGNDINPQRTKEFILRSIEYFNIINFQRSLQEFNPNPDQKLKPEDNIIKTLKQIITDLIKNYNEQLWIHYQGAIGQSKYTDHHISQFIQAMGIPYPQNIQSMAPEDENLKKINELLSKTKTFDLGVAQLRKYMTTNPQFVPVQYFTDRGYEQKFIVMVINALQSTKPRKTPTKRQVRQERSQNSRNTSQNPTSQSTIQERIRNLRMRFDEAPQNRQQQKPQITQPATTTAAGRQTQERGQQRALQIKKRIEDMRSRLGK